MVLDSVDSMRNIFLGIICFCSYKVCCFRVRKCKDVDREDVEEFDEVINEWCLVLIVEVDGFIVRSIFSGNDDWGNNNNEDLVKFDEGYNYF